jgi:hypothetical protein
MYKIEIYILNDRIELYQDETIQLESSVQNIKDISKVFTDYTESFTIPASQDNNKIFRHWYNSDILSGFDTSILIPAEIKLNGITYKTGKIKLESVTLKDGKAQNYKIKFFGKLINLTDLFGEDLLSELNLVAYSHAYNGANVKAGMYGNLLSGNIIYPLISSSRNWDYNTPSVDNEIKYSSGGGIAFNELKPAIKINRIIEAIETKYSITFSNDFLNNPDNDIEELFIWLNGTESGNIGSNNLTVDYNGGDNTNVDFGTDIGTFRTYNTSASNDRIYWNHWITIIPSIGYAAVDYSIKVYNGDDVIYSQSYGGPWQVQISESFFQIQTQQSGETIYNLRVEISSDEEFKFTTSWKQKKIWNGTDPTFITTSTEQTISNELVVTNNLPNMKVTDFFTSLVKMFNLVIDPITTTNFLVLPVDDWYGSGGVSDITDYIDVESFTVNKPELYKNINFKYEKATDILGEQFYNLFKVGYGDLEWESDADGGKLDIEVKFQNLLMERLTDTTTNQLTNIHIGNSFDKNLQSILLKPILFFNRGITNTTDIFGFIDENDVNTPINSYLNVGQESSIETNSNISLNFGAELSSWNRISETNSLFNLYWRNYITDLFDPKRREYEYKAYLPLSIINDLKLNNLIIINKKIYIVNSLSINLSTGLASLKLLNYIGEVLLYKLKPSDNATAVASLGGTSIIYALLSQNNKVLLETLLTGISSVFFNASQNEIKRTSANLIGTSSIFAMGLSKILSSVPNLQAVTNVGNTTTNILESANSSVSFSRMTPQGLLYLSLLSTHAMSLLAFQGKITNRVNSNFDFTLQFPENATASWTQTLQSKTGTIALLSDIVVGGATNLTYTASPTNGLVNSDTGTDATIPLGTSVNAGLLAPAQFTKLANTSNTNTGDQDLSGYEILTNKSQAIETDKASTTKYGSVKAFYDWAVGKFQSILVSGTNIKTINSTTILGSGNLTVQEVLVSGTNIKTINSSSILGTGNLVVSATLPYQVYVALVSQTGTSAPTAIILQNTLGVVPVWTRYSAGIYRATYANTFTQDKTTILTSTNYMTDSGIIQVTCNSGYSPDMIQLISYNKTMVLTDDLLVRTAIEIRVYP